MGTHTKVSKEVVVSTPAGAGKVSALLRAVAGSDIRMDAVCCYETGNMAHMRIVTDDDKKLIHEVLLNAGFDIVEHNVILAETGHHSHRNPFSSGTEENNYWCATGNGSENDVAIMPLESNSPILASIR